MLAIPRDERKKDGLKFVEDCKAEYDRLIEQSPPIPSKIMIEFDKEYPLENVFTKPEILTVRSIPILKLPKTIETVEAITKGTPLERAGKFLSKQPPPPNDDDDEISLDEEEEEEEEEEEIDVEQGTPKE